MKSLRNVRLIGCEVCPHFAGNVKNKLQEEHGVDIKIFILPPMNDSKYFPSILDEGQFIYGVGYLKEELDINGQKNYKNQHSIIKRQKYKFSELYNKHLITVRSCVLADVEPGRNLTSECDTLFHSSSLE